MELKNSVFSSLFLLAPFLRDLSKKEYISPYPRKLIFLILIQLSEASFFCYEICRDYGKWKQEITLN